LVQHWSRRCAPVLLVCVATARPAAAMCCRPSARRAQRSHEPDAWDGMPLAPEPRDDPVAGSGDGARLVRWVRSQPPQDHELPRPSVCSRLLIVARRAGGARQWALGPTRAIRPSVETDFDLRRTTLDDSTAPRSRDSAVFLSNSKFHSYAMRSPLRSIHRCPQSCTRRVYYVLVCTPGYY